MSPEAPVLEPMKPAGYSRTEPDNTGAAVLFADIHVPRHVHTVIPIWAIETPRGVYEATLPISVKLAFEDGMFYAANEALKLFGTGESPDEAIGELREHLAYFVEHYEDADADQLAGEASKMKDLYGKTFVQRTHAAREA